ncbi:MAG: 2-oxoacid:acceptor oxidoreductase subunit alpha [Nitrospirota bacterium]
MRSKKIKREILFQGNEAIVEGAIASGCRFFAGYPISPSSEIAEMMSRRLPELGGCFIQMEDEIASLGAVIGASLAGAKAMTATSGPGFSLMQENIGFGIAAEVPCVIVNVMRGGPSTGLPTSPSQGDVMQARWGTHGDHPAVVLSPSSVKECFELAVRAFNLSERYRIPVILLSDEIIGHMREKVALPSFDEVEVFNRVRPTMPPEWYIPYEDTPAGIPPMGIFGDGYRYHVTGLTHDIRGFPTSRTDEVPAFINRLHRKIQQNLKDIQSVEEFFTEDAEILVVSYGASFRSALKAVKDARIQGIKVGLIKLITLWPFMEKFIKRHTENAKVIIVPEMNMGQMAREIERVCCNPVVRVNRVDGTIIKHTEIFKAIKDHIS